MVESQRGGLPQLTPRELDVLRALCTPRDPSEAFAEPLSVREIAEELTVTQAAVKQHLLRLYDKFEIYDPGRRRTALANRAIALGVIAGRDLSYARRAVEGGEWDEAYAALHALDATASLEAADLESFGEAATWSGRPEEAMDARARAHAAYEAAGDLVSAARVALGLVINNVTRLRFPVAGGWLARARRALDGAPESSEHGYLEATTAMFQAAEGAFEEARASGERAEHLGRRLEDPDVLALGLLFQGVALVNLSRAPEGSPLLDEAMASAATGALSPFATGLIYCRTICACLDTFDVARALQWTEEVSRLDLGRDTRGFPGDCRTHRAELHVLRGEWPLAEEEANEACVQAGSFDLNHVASASATLAELHLRRGDTEGASLMVQRAISLGSDAQPAAALVYLASDDPDSARASIESALATRSHAYARARLLPAIVEIALAQGELDPAESAANELASIAEDLDAEVLHASAASASASVALAADDAVAASAHGRRAAERWRAIGAPFEVARSQLVLAEAMAKLGDRGAAMAELQAARSAFEDLGARGWSERARLLASSW